MADQPPTFSPEDYEREALTCDQLGRNRRERGYRDVWSGRAAMLRHAAATQRRLEAVEAQTCETCRFAGDEVSGAGFDMFRYCRLVTRGLSPWQIVPLVNANGEPHGCNSWKAQTSQETR